MKFEIGSKAFIIESSRIVREVCILKRSGDFYIIRFEDGKGGIQVRSTRLYHSKEDAETTFQKIATVEKPRSPYDYWH